jgi:hypothetical protein
MSVAQPARSATPGGMPRAINARASAGVSAAGAGGRCGSLAHAASSATALAISHRIEREAMRGNVGSMPASVAAAAARG